MDERPVFFLKKRGQEMKIRPIICSEGSWEKNASLTMCCIIPRLSCRICNGQERLYDLVGKYHMCKRTTKQTNK
jgi:hypothetical protein